MISRKITGPNCGRKLNRAMPGNDRRKGCNFWYDSDHCLNKQKLVVCLCVCLCVCEISKESTECTKGRTENHYLTLRAAVVSLKSRQTKAGELYASLMHQHSRFTGSMFHKKLSTLQTKGFSTSLILTLMNWPVSPWSHKSLKLEAK